MDVTEIEGDASRTRWTRADSVSFVLLGALLVLAASLTWRLNARVTQPVYAISPWTLRVVLAAFALTLTTATVVAANRNRDVGAIAATATALTLVGIALLPIGVVALLLAPLIWALLLQQLLTRGPETISAVVSTAGGILLAVGLSVIVLVAIQQPL